MLSGKHIIIILLVLSLVLTGCSKISRGELMDIIYDSQKEGKEICATNKMEYLTVEIRDIDDINVICLTSSPCKVYRYEVEI